MWRRNRRAMREWMHALKGAMAIDPRWLAEMNAAIEARDSVRIEALSFGWSSAVQSAEVIGGIGHVVVRGPLIEGFGGHFHDYSDIGAAVGAVSASATHGIVLDINSPGGVVAAELWDLADSLREVNSRIPLVAVANDWATSAAYVIAAQAGEIYASSRGAGVGSLGVIATHLDFSRMNEAAGVVVTEIVTGHRKNSMSENQPLSKEGRAKIEELIEASFKDLIDAVSAGRGLSESAIRAFEGEVFIGEDAVSRGLANGVRSLEEVMNTLRSKSSAGLAAATNAGNPQESAMEPTTTPGSSGTQQAAVGPSPVPTPTAAQPQGATVTDIASARSAGEQAANERMASIRQHCDLAGCPERLGEFLATSLTAQQVGARILEERAAAADQNPTSGSHTGGVNTPRPVIDAAAIYARRAREARGERGV